MPINPETALKLCLLERPNPACSYCGGTGIRKSTIGYSGHGDIEEARRRLNEMVPCSCQPSGGRIPLLDPKLVREQCGSTHGSLGGYKAWEIGGSAHTEAGCPSWVPSTDPWAYVRAAWEPERYHLRLAAKDAIVTALDHKQDPGQAAFDVVAKAMGVEVKA